MRCIFIKGFVTNPSVSIFKFNIKGELTVRGISRILQKLVQTLFQYMTGLSPYQSTSQSDSAFLHHLFLLLHLYRHL